MACSDLASIEDTAVLRVRTTAMELATALGAGESVTVALQRWCERYKIGSGSVEAEHVTNVIAGLPPPTVIGCLGLSAGTSLRFRHVVLKRGGVSLCEAVNWYVPTRLTDSMNEALSTTRTPFGLVVAPLGIHRVNQFFVPGSEAPSVFTRSVLEMKASVANEEGLPLAAVQEWFSPILLDGE
jgi:hypothetical protein